MGRTLQMSEQLWPSKPSIHPDVKAATVARSPIGGTARMLSSAWADGRVAKRKATANFNMLITGEGVCWCIEAVARAMRASLGGGNVISATTGTEARG